MKEIWPYSFHPNPLKHKVSQFICSFGSLMLFHVVFPLLHLDCRYNIKAKKGLKASKTVSLPFVSVLKFFGGETLSHNRKMPFMPQANKFTLSFLSPHLICFFLLFISRV